MAGSPDRPCARRKATGSESFSGTPARTPIRCIHGIDAARMDGIPGAGMVGPGDEFVYEFDARPFGCHLYHCHALPLKRHLHKGMYGAFIVDPDPARHAEHADIASSRLLGSAENRDWQELVMVMNALTPSGPLGRCAGSLWCDT